MDQYCLLQVNLRSKFFILKVAFAQFMSIFTDFRALFGKKMTPHLLPFEPIFDPSIETTPYIFFHKKLAIKSMT